MSPNVRRNPVRVLSQCGMPTAKAMWLGMTVVVACTSTVKAQIYKDRVKRVETLAAQRAELDRSRPLSGHELRDLRVERAGAVAVSKVDDLEPMDGTECIDLGCFATIEPLDGSLERRTPPLSAPVWELSANGLKDPQIAVSATHVVVTTGGRIRVFTRDRTLELDTTIEDFFKPLWDPAHPSNINTFLNLPEGAECDARDDQPGVSREFCLDTYYDARVIYDEYRDRFWIAALARNETTRDGNFDPNSPPTDKAEIAARRSKVVLAVSKTSDFFDGFIQYWWEGVLDDGACNDPDVEAYRANERFGLSHDPYDDRKRLSGPHLRLAQRLRRRHRPGELLRHARGGSEPG